MGSIRVLTVLSLAVAVSASPDGYTDGGVTPVSVSPSPRPYRPRSPSDSIFSGSSSAGVSTGGGYFPAVADGSSSGGRVISLGGGGRGGGISSGAYSAGGEGMPYDFGWAVQEPDTGNDFTHEETSDGVLTSGQYRVNLPDGRVQVVTYTVRGDSGYQAEVTYEGEAQYPPTPTGQGYNGPAVSQGYNGPAVSQGYSVSGEQQRYNSGASSGSRRYSSPSGNQQRYSSPSGGQQRYSSPSGGQQRYSSSGSSSRPAFSGAAAPSRGYSSRSGRRYDTASSSLASNSAPSTQYGAAPSPRPSSPAPSTQYGAAPSTQYSAAPSPRPSSPAPSTTYGAAPVTPRYSSGLSGQASDSGFGSRLTPLGGGVSYSRSDSDGDSPQLEETYGAPAAPSQSYGAV